MLLSVKHKFAFLCVPKCGSTSVERALKPHADIRLAGHPSLKHISARTFENTIRPMLRKTDPKREIETFCIVREPIEWLSSWHRYRARAQLNDPSHSHHRHHTGGLTFRQFAEAYLSPEQPEFARLGSQHSFVTLNNGSQGVDRIFRLDQMDMLADFLSEKIGKTIEIPKLNRSHPARGANCGRSGSGSNFSVSSRPEDELGLPPELLVRLKERFADDYSLYDSLAGGHPPHRGERKKTASPAALTMNAVSMSPVRGTVASSTGRGRLVTAAGAHAVLPSTLVAPTNLPLAYLTMPKAGCTTIRNILYRIQYGAWNPNPIGIHRQLKNDQGILLSGEALAASRRERKAERPFTVFTFVRDPASRAYSAFVEKVWATGPYSFPRIRRILGRSHGFTLPPLEEGGASQAEVRDGFRRFLRFVARNVAGQTHLPPNAHWIPQSKRIREASAHDLVGFIGRLENFAEDMSYILRKAGWDDLSITTQRFNEGPRPPFAIEEIMDAESAQLLAEIYHDDYSVFDYLPPASAHSRSRA
jgi:hypothetical protein